MNLLILLALLLPIHAQAAESGGCPIVVYRQYHCPSNPWEECDPFTLYAQADEIFCKMIVYIQNHHDPYIREVPGQLCYPDLIWGGQHCMAFYPGYAAAWTDGSKVGIVGVYVQSVEVQRIFMPMVRKR